MKSLIIGMGIGQLYQAVLSELGSEIITVDANPVKNADFITVEDALAMHPHFDTAHICTPNFTHELIANTIAPYCKIVFVEKPGVINSAAWKALITAHTQTRFMMVKNNQWRDNIDQLRALTARAKTVNLNWINKDRVPNPGTWFTTKELAFGGVSRDLTPHLLSIFMALEPGYISASETARQTAQQWQLAELTQTDYGVVKSDGIYDVDDFCNLQFLKNGRVWNLTAQWRSMASDCRQIEFVMPDDSVEIFELGLCPEDAYRRMIADAAANVDNSEFWLYQNTQDQWIHEKIESL